jgi:hypothetical protein
MNHEEIEILVQVPGMATTVGNRGDAAGAAYRATLAAAVTKGKEN